MIYKWLNIFCKEYLHELFFIELKEKNSVRNHLPMINTQLNLYLNQNQTTYDS